MGRKLVDLDTRMDELLAEFSQAEADKDDARMLAIVDQMEAVEDQQKRQKRYLDRRAGQLARVDALVADGMDWLAAMELVTGKSADKLTKERFIAEARSQGYVGAGFDALVTAVHRDITFHMHAKAVEATGGYMVKGDSTDDGYWLFTASQKRVDACATDELIEWFRVHGRMQRDEFRALILNGTRVAAFQSGR